MKILEWYGESVWVDYREFNSMICIKYNIHETVINVFCTDPHKNVKKIHKILSGTEYKNFLNRRSPYKCAQS